MIWFQGCGTKSLVRGSQDVSVNNYQSPDSTWGVSLHNMQQALAVFLRCSSQETKTSDRLSVFRTLHWCSWLPQRPVPTASNTSWMKTRGWCWWPVKTFSWRLCVQTPNCNTMWETPAENTGLLSAWLTAISRPVVPYIGKILNDLLVVFLRGWPCCCFYYEHISHLTINNRSEYLPQS